MRQWFKIVRLSATGIVESRFPWHVYGPRLLRRWVSEHGHLPLLVLLLLLL